MHVDQKENAHESHYGKLPGLTPADGQLHTGKPMCNYSLISYILHNLNSLVNKEIPPFREEIQINRLIFSKV